VTSNRRVEETILWKA